MCFTMSFGTKSVASSFRISTINNKTCAAPSSCATPGIAAIRAALAPQPNEEAKDAYFFVTDLKGSYYYARTLSEHSANCQKAAQVNKTVNTEK